MKAEDGEAFAKYHEEHARFGGASQEFHERAASFLRSALTLAQQEARAETVEEAAKLRIALASVLPYARDWLTDLRIEKRESEQQGFASVDLDATERIATQHIAEARALLEGK